MKQATLGILVIIMIVLVLSVESTLAILRVWTVGVTVDVVDSRSGIVATQEPTASPQATAQATTQGQAKAQSAVLTIRPSNAWSSTFIGITVSGPVSRQQSFTPT